MKRNCTLVLVLLLFSLLRTYAQKGSWFVGGQGGIGTSNSKITNTIADEASKSFSWIFSPEIGTYVSPNMQVGLGLITGISKNTNEITPASQQTSDSAMPYHLVSPHWGNWRPLAIRTV
ncbi:MAG: hypothetical protein NTW29_06460 [Bacteroidetes bacterium]|nr:hypothetical protein [Bacteroidota bacterium]